MLGGGSGAAPARRGASAAPGRRLRKDRDIYETFPGAAVETAGFAGDHVSTSPHSYERSRSPVTSGSPVRAGSGRPLRTPACWGGNRTRCPPTHRAPPESHQAPSSLLRSLQLGRSHIYVHAAAALLYSPNSALLGVLGWCFFIFFFILCLKLYIVPKFPCFMSLFVTVFESWHIFVQLKIYLHYLLNKDYSC